VYSKIYICVTLFVVCVCVWWCVCLGSSYVGTCGLYCNNNVKRLTVQDFEKFQKL